MGDPAGIGPEVIAGFWSTPEVHEWCSPVVVGNPAVMRRACELVATDIEVIPISRPDEVPATPNVLPCLTAGAADAAFVQAGKVDAPAARPLTTR